MTDPDISTMTPDAVRKEIADRLGWTDLEEHTYWEEDYYDTREVTAIEATPPHTDRTNRRLLPDWPNDPAAALELCEQIAFERDYKLLLYWFNAEKIARLRERFCPNTKMTMFVDISDLSVLYIGEADETSFALARLALTALRNEARGT